MDAMATVGLSAAGLAGVVLLARLGEAAAWAMYGVAAVLVGVAKLAAWGLAGGMALATRAVAGPAPVMRVRRVGRRA